MGIQSDELQNYTDKLRLGTVYRECHQNTYLIRLWG